MITESASLDEHLYAIRYLPRKLKRKREEVIGKLHSAKRNLKTQHLKRRRLLKKVDHLWSRTSKQTSLYRHLVLLFSRLVSLECWRKWWSESSQADDPIGGRPTQRNLKHLFGLWTSIRPKHDAVRSANVWYGNTAPCPHSIVVCQDKWRSWFHTVCF